MVAATCEATLVVCGTPCRRSVENGCFGVLRYATRKYLFLVATQSSGPGSVRSSAESSFEKPTLLISP